ncbi:MAG: TlpA family protein disulfide reductase [Myxococcales bacterium]|nr:TlpA family protein disulfide reductase [Myxococcales bacterium]
MTVPRPRWLVVAVVAACLAINVGWVVTHLDWLRPLVPGQPAPDFALPRIEAAGRDGPPVALSTLRGRVVVVEFWATWCEPCLLSLPHLDAAARRWGDRVVVVAVNVDDRAKARALFDQRRYQMVLAADDDTTSERYGVHQLPHAVVIDRAGVVAAVASRPSQIETAVARLLAAP